MNPEFTANLMSLYIQPPSPVRLPPVNVLEASARKGSGQFLRSKRLVWPWLFRIILQVGVACVVCGRTRAVLAA
jgi:hypothetical protein